MEKMVRVVEWAYMMARTDESSINEGEIVFWDGYMVRDDCLIARPGMGLAFIRNWKALHYRKLYKVVRLSDNG